MAAQISGVGGERRQEDLGKDEITHCDEIAYISRTHSQGEVSTRSDREMVSLSLGGASSSHQARLSTQDDASGHPLIAARITSSPTSL
jgi:hypothetical protein